MVFMNYVKISTRSCERQNEIALEIACVISIYIKAIGTLRK